MKYFLTLCTTVAALGAASPTFAADDSTTTKSTLDYKDNGGYESSRTSERTTLEGTKQESTSDVDVNIDSEGYMEKTIKAESSSDPKGLMNEKKNTSKTKIEEMENGGYKQTTITKKIDADGTDTTLTTITEVNVDGSGNITTTAKTEKVVDPKGLMNKKTTSEKTKSVNGKVVEKKEK